MQLGRQICCIYAICLCLFLGGCTPTANNNDGVIHLTLWQGINPPPNRDVFQELVAEFNTQHPQIQVESLYVGQADQQLPKILTAVIGDAAPDLLWYVPMLTGQLVELGAIQPLDDWLRRSPPFADLDPTLLDTMRLDGRLWSVPMATNNLGLFYRPSLFEQAGITELPQTWAQLRSVARRLTRDTDSDGQPEQSGLLLSLGKGEWTVFTWLPFLYSTGEDLLDAGRPQVVNEGAIAALQFWSELVQDGSALLSQPERGYEQDDFIAGRVAMQLTGPWTLGYLPETPAGDDFAVMPIPGQAQPATTIGGENLFVMTADPARQVAVQEFLNYVLSEPFQTRWSLGTGYLPVNLKARQSPAYQDFMATQPVLQTFLEQMAVGRSRPIIPGYAQLSDAVGRAIEATLLGTDPQTALEQAQARLDWIWPEPPERSSSQASDPDRPKPIFLAPSD
ncbi:MAG: ABC transporter substrate-binding protein [Spirulinaceae cyanobacterium]